MYNLTPENAGPLISKELLSLLLIGASFFLVGIIAAALITGHRLVDALRRNSAAIIVTLILVLALPITVGLNLKPTDLTSQASTPVQIQQLSAIASDSQTVVVRFQTSVPALVYLEYLDASTNTAVTVSPTTNASQKTFEHEFIISNVSPRAGTIIFIVNGKRFLLDGKPYPIHL